VSPRVLDHTDSDFLDHEHLFFQLLSESSCGLTEDRPPIATITFLFRGGFLDFVSLGGLSKRGISSLQSFHSLSTSPYWVRKPRDVMMAHFPYPSKNSKKTLGSLSLPMLMLQRCLCPNSFQILCFLFVLTEAYFGDDESGHTAAFEEWTVFSSFAIAL
jgi:hypothetical protein